MNTTLFACPVYGKPGKVVKLITLKALLNPKAPARLVPGEICQFCSDSAYSVWGSTARQAIPAQKC